MPTKPPIHGAAERKAQRTELRRQFDRWRKGAHDRAFYDSAAWQGLRRHVLNAEPLCRECLRLKRVRGATVVDHIVDRRDAPERALDVTNLQALCASCHNRKTALSVWHSKD